MRQSVYCGSFISLLWVACAALYLLTRSEVGVMIGLGASFIASIIYVRLMPVKAKIYFLAALAGASTLITAVVMIEGTLLVLAVFTLILALIFAGEAAEEAQHHSNAPSRRRKLYMVVLLVPVAGPILGVIMLRQRKPT